MIAAITRKTAMAALAAGSVDLVGHCSQSSMLIVRRSAWLGFRALFWMTFLSAASCLRMSSSRPLAAAGFQACTVKVGLSSSCLTVMCCSSDSKRLSSLRERKQAEHCQSDAEE